MLTKEPFTTHSNFTKNAKSKRKKYVLHFLLITFLLDKYPFILATFVYLSSARVGSKILLIKFTIAIAKTITTFITILNSPSTSITKKDYTRSH